jgi:hypothetical protein
MRRYALLATLLAAALPTALALAGRNEAGESRRATACTQATLTGATLAGRITFRVRKASGTSVTGAGKTASLVIPAGATVTAKICATAPGGVLTLRQIDLHVRATP